MMPAMFPLRFRRRFTDPSVAAAETARSLLSLAPLACFLLVTSACSIFQPGLDVREVKTVSDRTGQVAVHFRAHGPGDAPLALESRDIRVYEDGQPLPGGGHGALLSADVVKARFVLLLLDLSGPIVDGEVFPDLVSAVSAFGRRTIEHQHVAVAGYDGEPLPVLFVDFDENAAQGLARLARFRPRDRRTDLGNAISWGAMKLGGAMKAADAPEVEGTLVLVADNPDKAKRVAEGEAVARLREVGVRVFVYAAKPDVPVDLVRPYAFTDSTFVERLTELPPLVERIGGRLDDEASLDFVFAYCSAKRDGRHDLALEVSMPGAQGKLQTWFSADGVRGGCHPRSRPHFTPPMPSTARPVSPAAAAAPTTRHGASPAASGRPAPTSSLGHVTFSRPEAPATPAASGGLRFSRPPPPDEAASSSSAASPHLKISR
jgi:hypothetical protein